MVAHDAGLHDFHAAWIDWRRCSEHAGEGEGVFDGELGHRPEAPARVGQVLANRLYGVEFWTCGSM